MAFRTTQYELTGVTAASHGSADNITAGGVYRVATAAAATELGLPFPASGRLDVLEHSAGGMIAQRFTTGAAKPASAERSRDGNGWTAWRSLGDPTDTGWVAATLQAGTTGTIAFRRQGSTVHCRVTEVIPPAGSYAVHLASIPAGFQPREHFFWCAEPDTVKWHKVGAYNSAATSASTFVSWIQAQDGSATRPVAGISGNTVWSTDNAWPAL